MWLRSDPKKGKREQVLRDWRTKLGSNLPHPLQFRSLPVVHRHEWRIVVLLKRGSGASWEHPPQSNETSLIRRSRKALNPHTSVFTKVWVGRLTESTGQLALRLRRCVRRCVRGNVEEMTQWGKWGVSAMSVRCLLNISPIKGFDGTLRFVRGNTWLLKPLKDVYEP